jgi:hypothetical protein
MATLGQVEAVVRFIQNYMNDSNKPTKTAFYCSSPSNSFSLLNMIKNQIGAEKAGKNAIRLEHLTIYIFHKDEYWHIHIRNNDLVEPKGPM